nr:MAG TPA: hypothetical protein [Caudoviricetes sp.]DAO12123.1 MAG TPA: hypothetical protein [Caudoviricetes sp.]DAU05065.1 MAG TPA: hypothetical protein [Caudoviricetes sp.]
MNIFHTLFPKPGLIAGLLFLCQISFSIEIF